MPGKLSRFIGLSGQPEQILRLLPRGLRILRQGQEPGCLVRSSLNRQCMIEIRQTCSRCFLRSLRCRAHPDDRRRVLRAVPERRTYKGAA